MTITKKFLAVLILAGAASPLLAQPTMAGSANPCYTDRCTGYIGYRWGDNDDQSITECVETTRTILGDCTGQVKTNLLPPDLLRPNLQVDKRVLTTRGH